MSPLPSLAPWEPALPLIQLDTKCSCDLPQSLTVAVTSSLAPAPWRVNWKTVHDKLVTFHQPAGLRPGLPRISLATRCLARSLGKSGHVDTEHLFVGSDSLLCPLSPLPCPGVLRKGQEVGRLGMWKLGLFACWASGRGASGSLRIAPNHGSGLSVGSAASPCLSHSKAFGDRLCMFPVASMA